VTLARSWQLLHCAAAAAAVCLSVMMRLAADQYTVGAVMTVYGVAGVPV